MGVEGASLEVGCCWVEMENWELPEGRRVESCPCERRSRAGGGLSPGVQKTRTHRALGLEGRWGMGKEEDPPTQLLSSPSFPSLGVLCLLQRGHGQADNLLHGQGWVRTQRGPVLQLLVRTRWGPPAATVTSCPCTGSSPSLYSKPSSPRLQRAAQNTDTAVSITTANIY